METKFITKTNFSHNGTKFLAQLLTIPELQNDGPYARCTVASNGTTLYIMLPADFDESRLNALYAAHDPTPNPPAPALLNTDQAEGLDGLAGTVDTLRQYYNLASPSNAQTVGAFKLSLRVLFFVLKRVLGL